MAVLASGAVDEQSASTTRLTSLRAAFVRHGPLIVLLALVFGIHVPSLHYYFLGDDFVVIGDITTRSFPHYARDVVLLHDSTTSWRPLAMLAYWGEYRLFGLHALPWRLVNLGVHMATVALLYALVLSMTKRQFVALVAATIFAVSASAVHTVTYISALQHVMSEFFLIASWYALYRFVDDGRRREEWYWGSISLFVAAVLSNEGGVVIAAVLALYYATATVRSWGGVRDAALRLLPFALASVLVAGGLASCDCENVDDTFYSVGWHIPRLTWVYMCRLAYPVGGLPRDASTVHWVVGSLVIAAAIYALVRGPALARVAALGMVIGVLPYAPGHFLGTTSRYTYQSLPFFAILVALAAGSVLDRVARVRARAANAVAGAAIVVVAGLYSWQTIKQTTPFLETTEPWRVLAMELQRDYPSANPGSRIYVEDDDGTYSSAWVQLSWVPSVALSLYGKGVTLVVLPSADMQRMRQSLEADRQLYDKRGVRIAAAEGGRLLLVEPPDRQPPR